MDTIEKRVNELNILLPCKVKLYNIPPSNISPKLFNKLRSGSAGWVDPSSGDICLYRPNITPVPDTIDASVTFLGVSRKGLEGFLGERHYTSVCRQIGRMILRSEGNSIASNEELESIGKDFIKGLGEQHTKQWDDVAYFVSLVTDLKRGYSLAKSLCMGNSQYGKLEHNQAVLDGNYTELNKELQRSLEDVTDTSSVISLGKVSEVFERIGYPPVELKVNTSYLKDFLDKRGLEANILLDNEALFKIHNPMAVVKSHIQKENGKDVNNIFVTDVMVPGQGYLSFAVESTNDVFKGIESGRYTTMRIKSITTLSEYALIQALNADKGESVRYLQPKYDKDGTSYVISDHLRRMEGKSPEELGYKKSAGGTAPSLTSLQQSHRLIIATNIVENFKNPMSLEKRKLLFGETKYDSMVLMKQRMREEIPVTVSKPVVSTSQHVHERTYRERLMTHLDDHFSPNAKKRLTQAGITKAMDLISLGETKLKERYGIRAYKSAVEFLQDNNLSFSGSVKIKTISESSALGKTAEGVQQIRELDLVYSLSGIPDNVMARSIRMPRTADGTYLDGANSLNLISKTVSLPRWRDCNIFLTEKDIQDFKFQVNKGAIPCHLVDRKGNNFIAYNLSETNFAIEHPALFDSISELSRKTSAEVPAYLKNLMYGLKGVQQEDAKGVYQFIDNSYKRNISLEDLQPNSMNLRKLSAYASREQGIRNPLETRGRKSAKEVYREMESKYNQNKNNGLKR